MFEYASFAVRNPSWVTANMRKQWSVRKALLAYRKLNPVCAATGKTNNLQVHHVVPVSVRPDLAGDPANMIVLHKDAHLILGHAGDYKSYVTNVRQLCAGMKVQRTVAAE